MLTKSPNPSSPEPPCGYSGVFLDHRQNRGRLVWGCPDPRRFNSKSGFRGRVRPRHAHKLSRAVRKGGKHVNCRDAILKDAWVRVPTLQRTQGWGTLSRGRVLPRRCPKYYTRSVAWHEPSNPRFGQILNENKCQRPKDPAGTKERQQRKRPRSFLNVAFDFMPATTYSPTHFRVQYNRPCGA